MRVPLRVGRRLGLDHSWETPGCQSATISGGRPSDRAVLQASIDDNEDGGGVSIRQSNRLMLPTSDGTRLIGVGPDLLSIHMLSPYNRSDSDTPTGWARVHAAHTQCQLARYCEIAKPAGVIRTGLRYVNRIVTTDPDASRYLVGAPRTPSELPVQMTGFFNRTEHEYDDGINIRTIQAYNSPAQDALQPESEQGFLLDIDAFRNSEPSIEHSAAIATVENLHSRELVFFEALITDTARELFNDA